MVRVETSTALAVAELVLLELLPLLPQATASKATGTITADRHRVMRRDYDGQC
jgi:hypothetical protein